MDTCLPRKTGRGRRRPLPHLLFVVLAGLIASCSPNGQSDPERADALANEAEALRSQYELAASREAVEKYAAAIELWQSAGDNAAAASLARELGAVLEEIGESEGAAEAYTRGLTFSRAAGDRNLEALLLSDLGLTEVLAGNHDRAYTHCSEALEVARGEQYEPGLVKALDCLGEVAYHRGHLKEALTLHHQAEEKWLALDNRQHIADSNAWRLGSIYSDLGEFDRAEEYYQQALSLSRETGDRYAQTVIWNAIGRLHGRLGDFQDALTAFREARQLAELTGDPVWMGASLSGIALVYESMGDLPAAEENWTQSLEHYHRAGLKLAEADVLMSLGETRVAAGDADGALVHLQKGLELAKELENPRFLAWAWRLIGLAHRSKGDGTTALANYRKALAVDPAGEDQRLQARLMGNIGEVYEDRGDTAAAREHFARRIEISRAARDLEAEAAGLYRLARLSAAEGKLTEAREHVEEALRIAESLRGRVASGKMRASYLASVHQYYKLLIDVLMRLADGDPAGPMVAAALEVNERVRARSLLDSLIEAGVDVRAGADPELLARETALKRKLDGKAERLMTLMSGAPDENEVRPLEEEIRDLSAEVDRLEAEIRSKSPRYAALMQPQPLRLDQIQTDVLDAETLLLEYALGEERSYLWAVSRAEHQGFELPPRAEIEAAARELYQMLTARRRPDGESMANYRRRVRTAEAGYGEAARRLSRMLLGPVAGKLGRKRLLVVSDGVLQYIPFAALPSPSSAAELLPLVVEHEIVNLPSVSTLAVIRGETRGRTAAPLSVAVLADPVFEADDPRLLRATASTGSANGRSTREATLRIPRLAASRREAKAIVAMAPKGASWLAIDFEASRATAMSPRLGRYRIVHFATHAVIDTELSGLSRIILSMVDEQGRPQNGFLRLDDIYNLDLPAKLVVLSACDSALGKDVRGEGLIGLVRGFLYAGSQQVIASLWKVDDEATMQLMTRFYRHLFEEKLSPAAALRQAQIAMWRDETWRNPFHWSAFVLQGGWD